MVRLVMFCVIVVAVAAAVVTLVVWTVCASDDEFDAALFLGKCPSPAVAAAAAEEYMTL